MADDSNEKVVWFIAGAAIGAAIALLYAPTTGQETRRYLGDKSRQGRDAVATRSREIADRGRQLVDRGRQIAGNAAGVVEEGRHLVEVESENPGAEPAQA